MRKRCPYCNKEIDVIQIVDRRIHIPLKWLDIELRKT